MGSVSQISSDRDADEPSAGHQGTRQGTCRAVLFSMSDWPELPLAAWRDTYATLLLYTQIVGKIRLALTPTVNEWWNVSLHVTTQGLTTGPMPYGDRLVSIDFDFVHHELVVRDSSGRTGVLPLVPRSVRDFHDALFAELAAMDVQVRISPEPQECPVTTPFTDDVEHASYDRDRVRSFWEALRRVEPVFETFRSRFRGKCSPVQFFWGAFDLAVARYNGKRAPARKGLVERLAYDEEVSSLGFWPGDPWRGTIDASFYAYTVPEPPGFAAGNIRPTAAFFDETLKEYLLPYDVVRRSDDPARTILEFAESTYDIGSKLAGWDRAALAYP